MLQKKKILIVDSDLVACRSYQKLFEKAGFEATCYTDGWQALEKADGSYDCIVIDTSNLPKVDGWEIIVRLKDQDHLKKIPVIVATVLDGDHYRQKAKDVGADGFVSKFNSSQVLAEVSKILRGGAVEGNLH